jgi:cell division protein FtsQ
MLQLIDRKYRIIIYLIFFFILSTTSNKHLESQKRHLLKINVNGLSGNNNKEILDKLNNLLFKDIFFLKQEQIKNIILKNNLVESFTVKKIYPKQINIDIKQTEFIAKIKGNTSYLIGSNGKLISNEYTNKKLPLMFGKFDSEKFLNFNQIVESSKFKIQNFKSIFFYLSNRWDILTMNDVLIKLPEQNLSEALNLAYKITNDDNFKNNKIIDLRVYNHIVIKNDK